MPSVQPFAASPWLNPTILARRVYPQLATQPSDSDVKSTTASSGGDERDTPDSDTVNQHQQPATREVQDESDQWSHPLDEEADSTPHPPSSASPTPLSMPVTLRLCALGIGASIESVLSFLKRRQDVNQLDLRANGLSDESLAPLLAAMIGELSHIRALDLSGVTGFAANRIGQRAAEALSSLLASPSCQLTTLRLAAMGRSSLTAAIVQHSFMASSASLTSLDLSGNDITNGMVRALCRQLSSQRCALRRLNLARNSLNDACCDALAHLMRQSTELSELSLAANQLTGRGIEVIAAALELDTCALTSLTLDDNDSLGEQLTQITASESSSDRSADAGGPVNTTAGVDRLFRSLSVNSSLQRLSLCGCSIASVCELSSSLAVNSTLTALMLDRNPLMRSAGCAELMAALAHNTTLLSLSLAHNRLDDSIAAPLAQLIQANPYLQSLSLADNQLTDAFILAVLPTVYLNSHCAVSRLDLTRNHLQGKHTARLHTVMQRNGRVQRRRLLTHYQHTISRLHALPGQLREAANDIERLQRECDNERSKEASTAQRVAAERAGMEADTVRMRAQLDAMREERRQQAARQSAELAALSSRLAAERGALKSQAAALRQEVVNEKKIQAQLAKQISRASAVWDSLEEIRRSGDIVERSLQQQISQLTSDAAAAEESCSEWAVKLQHTATGVVNKYWIALNTYTHSKRFADRLHSAQAGHRASAQWQHTQPSTSLSATLSLASPNLRPPSSALSSSLLSPSGVSSLLPPVTDWSTLETSGVLSFVPRLPSIGPSFDVDMADFLSWFFSTSTPSATLALIPAAMSKRMPVIAFAQSKCQSEAGKLTILFVQPAVATPHMGPASNVTSSSLLPTRRSHVPLLGLLRISGGESSSARQSLSLVSLAPALFSGCTLVVHPADSDTARERQRSIDIAAAAAAGGDRSLTLVTAGDARIVPSLSTHGSAASADAHHTFSTQPHSSSAAASSASASSSSSASASSLSSVLQLSIESSSTWQAVLHAVSGLLSVDCASPSSSVQVSCLPGIRLIQPLGCYLDLAADTPRLTLEEAMSELGGLNAITAAAAHRKQHAAVEGRTAVGEVSDTALPTLSDDLNQLLADIGADLILSARSRPPQHHNAHYQQRKNSRRAEGRQHTANVAAQHGPAAAAATAHSSNHESVTNENSDSDSEAAGGNNSEGRNAASVSVARRTSTIAPTAAGGGSRSHSHSLHRPSVAQQPHSRHNQQQQHEAATTAPQAAAVVLVASNKPAHRSLHARHSSLLVTLPSDSRPGTSGSGSSGSASRIAHRRTASRQLSVNEGVASKHHKRTSSSRAVPQSHHTHHRSSSILSVAEQADQHDKHPPHTATRAPIPRRRANRTSRHSSHASSTRTLDQSQHGQEERSTDEDDDDDEQRQLAEEADQSERAMAAQHLSNERPITPRVALSSLDVSAVARQPPAVWWSGTRSTALASRPSLQQTTFTRSQPLPPADYSLGQSDALMPFARSSGDTQHSQLAQHQPQHHPMFAHLALSSKQADFTADDEYLTSTRSAAPRAGHESGATEVESGRGKGAANLYSSHWLLLSRLVAAPDRTSETSATFAQPALSAACLAAIRPWPALCAPTLVN